jgi:hypothetical protein
MPKVKIEEDLYRRAAEHASERGYSSVEEFVAHLLEQALRAKEEMGAEEAAAVERRLKGLGYIE